MASDAGTILNPRTFAAQLHGGGVQGFGVARGQKWVYDRRWGLHVSKRFYSNRPPTMLDVPYEKPMDWIVSDDPDPFSPLGAKGIGEAPQGAGTGAVLCALADALGRCVLQSHADHDGHDPDASGGSAGTDCEAGGPRLGAPSVKRETRSWR